MVRQETIALLRADVKGDIMRHDIDTNYGYGWETESSYDTYEEAKRDLPEYQLMTASYGGYAKIVRRRDR